MDKPIDLKEHLLSFVQKKCIMRLKNLDDPDELLVPLRQKLVTFRDSIITGSTLKPVGQLDKAWRRLQAILDYYSAHFPNTLWFNEMRLEHGELWLRALDIQREQEAACPL